MSDASPASQAAVLPGLALAGALAATVFMGALAFVPVGLAHG